MKNTLAEFIIETLKNKRVYGENQYIVPNIPIQKIDNFIVSNKLSLDPDDVLFLDDQTLLGGAKESLIITHDAIYAKELFESLHVIHLNNIERVYNKKRKLYINDNLFYTLPMTDIAYVNALSEALSIISSSWDEYFEEEEDDENDELEENYEEDDELDEEESEKDAEQVEGKRFVRYYLYETEDSEDEKLHQARIECAHALKQGRVPLERHIVLNDWLKKHLQDLKNQKVTKKLKLVGFAEKFTNMILAPTDLHFYEASKKNYNQKAELLEFVYDKTCLLLELVINFSESLFKNYYVNDEDFKFAFKNEIVTLYFLAFLHGMGKNVVKNDALTNQLLKVIFEEMILNPFIKHKVSTVKEIHPEQILTEYNRYKRFIETEDYDRFCTLLLYWLTGTMEEWCSCGQKQCYHSFNFDENNEDDSFREVFFEQLRCLAIEFYSNLLGE